MSEDVIDEEMAYILAIDEAVANAGKLMSLDDIPEDASEEEYEDIYQDRFHCGVCVTRTVMEAVWPEVEKYVAFLKGQAGGQS